MSTSTSTSSNTAMSTEANEPVMDRVVKDVVAPPLHPLSKQRLFDNPKTSLPNLVVLKEHLVKEGRLAKDAALQLVNQATALLHNEPNLLELKYPITVCGMY
jgi:serine/threonine-protein phosphatase 2B catalytic subunit